MQAGKLNDVMTFDQLAKIVHMNPERLRARCISAGIAIQWGGTDEHPRLRARLSEVEKMILGRRYRPPEPAQPAKQKRQAKPLHRLVKC